MEEERAERQQRRKAKRKRLGLRHRKGKGFEPEAMQVDDIEANASSSTTNPTGTPQRHNRLFRAHVIGGNVMRMDDSSSEASEIDEVESVRARKMQRAASHKKSKRTFDHISSDGETRSSFRKTHNSHDSEEAGLSEGSLIEDLVGTLEQKARELPVSGKASKAKHSSPTNGGRTQVYSLNDESHHTLTWLGDTTAFKFYKFVIRRSSSSAAGARTESSVGRRSPEPAP